MLKQLCLFLTLIMFAACSSDSGDDAGGADTSTQCGALECTGADADDEGDAAGDNGDADEGDADEGDATATDAAEDAEDTIGVGEDVAEVDAGEGDAEVGEPTPELSATESNEADILYGWVAAGQPSEARVEEVVATGATIISLRYPNEDPFDEQALVESLGGTFIRYPTSGADYESVSFREGMYDLYDEQRAAGNIVYLHCASSNRVGASWALYQAERNEVPPEEAIAMGQAAGLSSLESTVRQLLGI